MSTPAHARPSVQPHVQARAAQRSRRGMARAACALLAVAAALATTSPRLAAASEYHSQDFRFGQRAMAMGGAVVGMVTGPTASFYNPAGLAFLRGTSFSGALQYYGLDRRDIVGAIRDDAIGTVDLRSGSFLATPRSSVLTHSFAGGRHQVAYSTYLVTNVDELFFGSLSDTYDDESFRNEQTIKASWRQRDRTLYMGPSYAFQINQRWSIGISLFYVRRDQTVNRSADDQTDQYDLGTDAFHQSVFYDDATAVTLNDGALLARIGVMARPTPSFSLGATVRVRSVRLHGEGTESIKYAYSGDQGAGTKPDRLAFSDDLFDVQSVYPWSFSAGAGWQVRPWLLLSVSGELDLALRYDRFATDPGAEAPKSVARTVERQLNWNISVGAEVKVLPRVPLRIGWFTNRSAAPDIPTQRALVSAPRVDKMGVTFSGGYMGPARSVNIGAEFAWGEGHDAVLAQSAQPLSDFVRVPRRERRLILFLSGAVSFAKATAKEVIRDKFTAPKTDAKTDSKTEGAPK